MASRVLPQTNRDTFETTDCSDFAEGKIIRNVSVQSRTREPARGEVGWRGEEKG